MATIKRFEDIEAWQLARELTRYVYEATKHAGFAHDYGLKDQMQRASVSIMSNIAEGFERGGKQGVCKFSDHSQRLMRGGPFSALCCT